MESGSIPEISFKIKEEFKCSSVRSFETNLQKYANFSVAFSVGDQFFYT